MNRRKRTNGFTLIELLVAMLIFAVLSVMAYGGLNVVLEARERMDDRTEQLAELQMTFILIGRDIEQSVNRAIRDEFGDPLEAMVGDGSNLEFTRAGWRNPAGFPRSELQRVRYTVDDEEHELRRIHWPTLDRTQANEPLENALLAGVDELEFRYLMEDGEWLTFWPPSAEDQQSTAALPRVVEITVETEQWGRITRLFRTPGLLGISGVTQANEQEQ